MIDKFSTARLMDLGIANTSINTAGFGKDEFGVIGTPRFAAPEQFYIPGNKNDVNRTSDLYELAVTIYELITCQNPYTGESIKDIAYKHFNEKLPEHPNMNNRILTVLRKATEPLQSRRYLTANELKNALNEAITPKHRHWLFRN